MHTNISLQTALTTSLERISSKSVPKDKMFIGKKNYIVNVNNNISYNISRKSPFHFDIL